MKSWTEKLQQSKVAQTKAIDKAIAGMPAGAMMHISTPQAINHFVQQIPYGQTLTVAQMRDQIAKLNGADCTCPLTTGIFLRIVAEAAFEAMQKGDSNPTPFWRVIEPDSKLAKKLSFDVNLISQKRAQESIVWWHLV